MTAADGLSEMTPVEVIRACLGEIHRYRQAIAEQLPRIEAATATVNELNSCVQRAISDFEKAAPDAGLLRDRPRCKPTANNGAPLPFDRVIRVVRCRSVIDLKLSWYEPRSTPSHAPDPLEPVGLLHRRLAEVYRPGLHVSRVGCRAVQRRL